MTKEDRALYERLDKRLESIEDWQRDYPEKYGEKIIRMNEQLTGENGVCTILRKHDRALAGKLSKGEFRWIMGAAGGVVVILFSLLITGTI